MKELIQKNPQAAIGTFIVVCAIGGLAILQNVVMWAGIPKRTSANEQAIAEERSERKADIAAVIRQLETIGVDVKVGRTERLTFQSDMKADIAAMNAKLDVLLEAHRGELLKPRKEP